MNVPKVDIKQLLEAGVPCTNTKVESKNEEIYFGEKIQYIL